MGLFPPPGSYVFVPTNAENRLVTTGVRTAVSILKLSAGPTFSCKSSYIA
jgi:hypothetical protein